MKFLAFWNNTYKNSRPLFGIKCLEYLSDRVTRFISQVEIDESRMESDEMKTIWKETCYLCML